MTGSVRSLIKVQSNHLPVGTVENNVNPVRVGAILAEIRIGYLMNMSLVHYPYTSMLSQPSFEPTNGCRDVFMVLYNYCIKFWDSTAKLPMIASFLNFYDIYSIQISAMLLKMHCYIGKIQ